MVTLFLSVQFKITLSLSVQFYGSFASLLVMSLSSSYNVAYIQPEKRETNLVGVVFGLQCPPLDF